MHRAASSIEMAQQAADDGIEAGLRDPAYPPRSRRGPRSEGRATAERVRASGGTGSRRAPPGAKWRRPSSRPHDASSCALGDGWWIPPLAHQPLHPPGSGAFSTWPHGHRCLIAHPELHLAEDLADRLVRLVLQGALIRRQREFFVREDTGLAERRLVHVLGSRRALLAIRRRCEYPLLSTS